MILDEVLAQTQQPTDVLSQKILINGSAISNEIGVLSITVSRQFNRIATAKIVLIDGDPAKREFKLSNENLFKPGNDIEISLGYHENTQTVFKGIITKHALRSKKNT